MFVDYCRVLQLRRQLPPGPLPLPLFGHYFVGHVGEMGKEVVNVPRHTWKSPTYNSQDLLKVPQRSLIRAPSCVRLLTVQRASNLLY